MENIIKPDKKLLTKQWMILLSLSVLVVCVAIILQIFVPLDNDVDAQDLAAILWPVTLGVIALKWILLVPILTLWVKNLKYVLKEDRVNIHKGILSKIQQNIPYRAITDFVLHRSLYDRFLGIASIRIQTAGQSQNPTGYEGNMAGLIGWEELHRSLRNKIKTLHPQSEALGITEKAAVPAENDVMKQILNELKEIRKVLEK